MAASPPRLGEGGGVVAAKAALAATREKEEIEKKGEKGRVGEGGLAD